MTKLWRRPNNNETTASSAVEADLSSLRIEKPSLIFLNGFFITDKSARWIPASLKSMEDLIAPHSAEASSVDVYSWTHAGLKDLFNMAAYCMRPGSRSCSAVNRLAAGLIMPLVAKDFKINEDGRVTGILLPLDEAKKNLRNITFFGYSAGCITAQGCFNASLKMMKELGHSEKDARDALHEVVYVGVGGVSRPWREKDRFTTLHLEASNDKVVRLKNKIWAPLRALFARFARRLKIRMLGEHTAIISAAVPRRNWETFVRNGKTVMERVHPLLPHWLPIKTYHERSRYVTQDEELSPFAKMVHYSLANAVARTQRLSPIQLLSPPPGADKQTADLYREKISQACNHQSA